MIGYAEHRHGLDTALDVGYPWCVLIWLIIALSALRKRG